MYIKAHLDKVNCVFNVSKGVDIVVFESMCANTKEGTHTRDVLL